MTPAKSDTFTHEITLYWVDQKLDTDSPGTIEEMEKRGVEKIPISMIPSSHSTEMTVKFSWYAEYYCELRNTLTDKGWPAHWQAHSCRVGKIKFTSHMFGGIFMADADYETGGFDALFRDNIQKYLDLWIEANAESGDLYPDVSCS